MTERVGSRVLLVLTVLTVLTLTGAATLPAKSTTEKAQQFVDKCRSYCIVQLTPDASRRSCLEGEQCLRCWAACKAFQSDRFIRDYCKHNKACTVGCRQACRFYRGQFERRPAGSGQTPTPPSVRSGQTVTPPPVIIGLARRPDFNPDSAAYSLAVNQRHPLNREDAEAIKSPDRQPVEAGWRPRLAGMVSSASLVSATVSWSPRGAGGQYLVTWELLSGGLRGHLVSDETTVSLPLWPDEQYLVQVFCDGGASQLLRLDTHQNSYEAAREMAADGVSEVDKDIATETAPEAGPEGTPVSVLKSAFYSDPESGSTDSGSFSESESADLTRPAADTGVKSSRGESSHVESSPVDEHAAVLTPASHLESAALISSEADSDSDFSPSQPSSSPSEPVRVGQRSSACTRLLLKLPTLLTLLTLLIILLAACLMMVSGVCFRSQKPREHQHQHHQQQQHHRVITEQGAITDDQRTLLDCRQGPWRTSSAPYVSTDPRRPPVFIVPCHKR